MGLRVNPPVAKTNLWLPISETKICNLEFTQTPNGFSNIPSIASGFFTAEIVKLSPQSLLNHMKGIHLNPWSYINSQVVTRWLTARNVRVEYGASAGLLSNSSDKTSGWGEQLNPGKHTAI